MQKKKDSLADTVSGLVWFIALVAMVLFLFGII
jgi:hypothetical protein